MILLVNKKTIGAPVCVLSTTNVVHDGQCTNPFVADTEEIANARKRSILARATHTNDLRCKNIVRRFTMFVVPTEEPKTHAAARPVQPVFTETRLFEAEPD